MLHAQVCALHRRHRVHHELDHACAVGASRSNTLRVLSAGAGIVLAWKATKSIGFILEISPRTVNVHAASIVRKLGAENRLQAAVMAIRAGILAQDG
jgi:DNA-binding CsgD family transcriptional regulator